MGYYDSEPQATETESTIELPTDAFERVETQATEDADWDEKDKKYY